MSAPGHSSSTDARVAEVLAAFGLGPVLDLRPLGGTAARKWNVLTSQGRFVVRRRPDEFADAGAAGFDHAVLRRLAAAGFPVEKRLEEFALTQSSVPRATYDYLASLEWIAAAENLCLVGPAGTGKSHLLIALGHAAVEVGHRVRYLTAADLVEMLYRGLADNSVGKQITALLRCELLLIDEVGFAPLDATGTQLLFRFVAAAYEHRSLGIASHWPFEDWGRFLPEQTTAVSLLDRLLHHATVVVTEGESYRMKEARSRRTTPKLKDE